MPTFEPLAACPTPPAPNDDGRLFGHAIALARLFGMRGEQIGDDRARVRLPHRADFSNSRGDVHGGAISALFDSVLACAVRAHEPQRWGVLTVDLCVHFLASGRGDVVAEARCDLRGRSLCFARGEAYDDHGRLLATATGTFKLVERQPAGPVPSHPSSTDSPCP